MIVCFLPVQAVYKALSITCCKPLFKQQNEAVFKSTNASLQLKWRMVTP